MALFRIWFLILAGIMMGSLSLADPALGGDLSLRSALVREFGIEAIDKTDRHAVAVLRNLLFLLRNAFPPGFVPRQEGVRYLYAYASHDSFYDLGAYHPEEKAISVGGASSYPGARSAIDPRILATLAHELGHAFLLARLSPGELRDLGERFGGWAPAFPEKPAGDFYAKEFFTPSNGLKKKEEEPLGDEAAVWKSRNTCSRLAATNMHEWFADAFAAFLLLRLGEKGLLGQEWRKRLVFRARYPGEYWSDYNLLSPALAEWFRERVQGGGKKVLAHAAR